MSEKIINKTRNKIISEDFKQCSSLLSKGKGLMFSLRPKTLVFRFDTERIVDLHMLFVFFPIDVLFLNKKKFVVELKEGLEPFHLYHPTSKAMYVIELPSGSIRKTKTSINDAITFK